MIFETHAHYDDPAFDEDRESLLPKLPEEGITRVVNVAASLKGCRDSLDLAKKYDFIYASIGVHPSDTGELTDDDLAFMEKLCREEALQQGERLLQSVRLALIITGTSRIGRFRRNGLKRRWKWRDGHIFH